MLDCWTVLLSSKSLNIRAGSNLGGCAGGGTCLVVNGGYFGWGGNPGGGVAEGLDVSMVMLCN